MKKVLIFLLILLLLPGCGHSVPPEIDTQPQETAPEMITENELGQYGGLDYELWKDYGNTEMSFTDTGFVCRWSDINNALFRMGRKFDCDQNALDYRIAVDYAAEYFPVGNSYLCVYGWTREPLVEYYVVQSWGNWRPPGAEALGTVEIGGATYDIYHTTRVNQPSIDGNATFSQFWSVRKGKAAEGTVELSEHFKAWDGLGLTLGKLYEVALTVEGYQSSGYAEITRNEITVES